MAQNKYISSKRASRVSGYAQDYVGQLVRMGKLSATKVGKSWFVEEAGLMRLINQSNRLESPSRELANLEVERMRACTVKAGISYPATWSAVSYIDDNSPLLPVSDSRDAFENMNIMSKEAHSDAEFSVSVAVRRNLNRSIGIAKAVTFDGVRFSAPELDMSPHELVIGEHSEPQLETSNARSRAFRTSVGGMVLRTLSATLIVSIVAFLIPIFG